MYPMHHSFDWVFVLFLLMALMANGYYPHCPERETETCPTGEPIQPNDWTKPRVFDDMTMKEIQNVVDYMSQVEGLDLIPIDEASLSDPFIFAMELIPPKKDDVLAHLDHGGPAPRREARVIVLRGDLPEAEARIDEYRVGPLPNPTEHSEYRNSKWKYPIPFTARCFQNLPEMKATYKWVKEQLKRVNSILEESTGYTVKDEWEWNKPHSKSLIWFPLLPAHVEAGHHQTWIYVTRRLEGGFLYPIGLQVLLNQDSADYEEWTIDKVWYQGAYFNSLDSMLDAYNSGDLVPRKLEEPEGAATETQAASMNFRGNPLPQKKQGPTKSYYPHGRRFKVDGHHVEWMGWQLDLTLRTSQGLLVHDIRYRGERIAYEISLQEIAVLYSGYSPLPMHSTLYDSDGLTGSSASQLFRGIDCPDVAVFFDFPFYVQGQPLLFKDVMCVFESDRDIPLRRHYDGNKRGQFNWAQGMRDIVFITRAVFTVDNYDYITDVILHQGGEIEVKVSLTGYTVNSYYLGPDSDKYGHQTLDNSLANIHHHVVHFKADLDIGGRTNRFHSVDISMEEQDDPVFPGLKTYNRVVTRNLKTTETEAALKYDFDNQGYLVQYNENIRNKWNYPKGYRIAPVSMTKLLLPEPYRGDRAKAWMRYQVAVTKQHDDEARSSSQYAAMEPYDPVMSFQDYIDDNESILDQDLVSWITLGVHHIPHSEDVPVVLTPAVQLTFFLLPYNYFDEDPSLASRDNVRVTPGENGDDRFEYAGVRETSCCRPQTIDGNGNSVDCVPNKGFSVNQGLDILHKATGLLSISFVCFVFL